MNKLIKEEQMMNKLIKEEQKIFKKRAIILVPTCLGIFIGTIIAFILGFKLASTFTTKGSPIEVVCLLFIPAYLWLGFSCLITSLIGKYIDSKVPWPDPPDPPKQPIAGSNFKGN